MFVVYIVSGIFSQTFGGFTSCPPSVVCVTWVSRDCKPPMGAGIESVWAGLVGVEASKENVAG